MPEAKNTFLKAKMNKDLDERLLPNGEYRHAQNIIVGKSEDDSVGTVQAVKGNLLITSSDLPIGPTDNIVGYYMDETNNRIFTFLDDNTIRVLEVPYNGAYDPEDTTISYTTLVSGSFLNFSKRTYNPDLERYDQANFNINLIEDLLFWTDNQNQPRKINVKKALADPNYYTKEEHISVAKYNPYQPISLFKQEIELITSATATSTSFEVAENAGIVEGMTVLAINPSTLTPTIEANEYVTVTGVSTASGTTTVTVSDSKTWTLGDKVFFVISTMSDKSNDTTWPGDPDYLESKFVRIGYRFKFDDNEYSIFSPFTQIAYIPKQKGFFLNGQEQEAVSSTILSWFENSVNNVDLIIPLPDKAYNIVNSYKIKSIEILYKESDQIPVKVIDAIDVTGLVEEDHSENYYEYSYQSRKPIRTLPEAQTVRVYDKVPVKAKTQEIISNRVVYGNFLTKHTPPDNISYSVSVQKKNDRGGNTNFIEYPNHTLKQNRNYQVGFVLADKFGRQSDVILSKVKNTTSSSGGVSYGGSTVYTGYVKDDPEGSGDIDSSYFPNGVIGWEGNALVLNVSDPIQGNSQTPLYAEAVGTGFDIEYSTTTTITSTTYTFVISTVSGAATDIPASGKYMRGQYVDYVKVTGVTGAGTSGDPYVVTTDGQVHEMYLIDPSAEGSGGADSVPDTKFAYTINPLGWYSYKIVVKQTEQEYYNVYLPSAIGADDGAGGTFVADSTDTSAAVSYITLINDNINKVPRDLAEVGPDQKQYRSSVRLFGRVQPTADDTTPSAVTFSNTQFYPINKSDVSTAVGNTEDLLGTLGTNNEDAIFQYSSKPIIARVSTDKQFGIDYDLFNTNNVASGENRFQLAIYETEPVVSALDIYWETSEVGLVSDLNWDVLSGYDGPVAFEDPEATLNENFELGEEVTDAFWPLNNLGTQMATTECTTFTVTDTSGLGIYGNATNRFTLTQASDGSYLITTADTFVYEYNSSERDVFKVDMTLNPTTEEEWENVTLSFTFALENTVPSWTQYLDTEDPYYYYTLEDEENALVHDFANNNPVNGAHSTADQSLGLRWDLDENYGDHDLFNLSADGKLTLTADGAAAGINQYTILIILRDATSGSSEDDGSRAAGKYINIIKGYAKSNLSNAKGLVNGIFDPDNLEKSYIYYLSNNTYSASDFPSVNPTPTTVTKVGNELTLGSFIFGIEKAYAQNYAGSNPSATPGDVSLWYDITVYRRASSGDDWELVNDLNNRQSDGASGGTGKYLQALSPENQSDNSRSNYRQNWWFAQTAEGTDIYTNGNKAGEYAFIVNITSADIEDDYQDVQFFHTYYVRDLHYTSATPKTQEVYKYTVYKNTGDGWTSQSSAEDSGSTQTLYSDQPLGEYNRLYFTDENLTTIWTPTPAGAGKWYLFKLDQDVTNTRNIIDKTWHYSVSVSSRRYDCVAKVDADGSVNESNTSPNPYTFTRNDSTTNLQVPFRRGTDEDDADDRYFDWE